MRSERQRRRPQLVVTNGEATGVIVEIGEYQKLLEYGEDTKGLQELAQMRREFRRFTKMQQFLRKEGVSI